MILVVIALSIVIIIEYLLMFASFGSLCASYYLSELEQRKGNLDRSDDKIFSFFLGGIISDFCYIKICKRKNNKIPNLR